MRSSPNEYTDKYYILKMYTGENGRGKWENYFSEMLGFVNNMKGKGYNIWMIDWINDCADDVSTIRFGFSKLRNKTIYRVRN